MVDKTLDVLSAWDARLFEHVFGRRGLRVVDRFFVWLSRSADGPLYVLLAMVLTGARAPRAIPFTLCLAAGFALDAPIYQALKTSLKRRRPGARLPGVRYAVVPPDEYSFPSGHAAGATLVATVTAACYPACATVALAWAVGVGVSRVYNGCHFPADVLAGSGLGWACAQVAMVCVL